MKYTIILEPLEGIEPSTYSLPRNRYTSKPQRHDLALYIDRFILLFAKKAYNDAINPAFLSQNFSLKFNIYISVNMVSIVNKDLYINRLDIS